MRPTIRKRSRKGLHASAARLTHVLPQQYAAICRDLVRIVSYCLQVRARELPSLELTFYYLLLWPLRSIDS